MTTVEILKAAKERIGTPERWTKGAFARASTHRIRAAQESDAVCWCAIGAIRAVAGREESVYQLLRAALPAEWCNVAQFNDAATHPDVMALFDRAIALAEASS